MSLFTQVNTTHALFDIINENIENKNFKKKSNQFYVHLCNCHYYQWTNKNEATAKLTRHKFSKINERR